MSMGNVVLGRVALIVGLGVLLGGCTQPQRRVMISSDALERPISAYSTPADLRLTFIRSPHSKELYFCAEPMPDVSLGSTTEISAAAKGNTGAEAALSATYASTLKSLNESARKENKTLRKELEKALDEYKKETGKELKTSVESSLDLANSSESKSTSDIELQAAVKLAATVSELGGRSKEVLLAREFLYRICEARANGFFHGGQAYVDMQQNALRMIVELSRTSQKSSTETRLELLQKGIELQKAKVSICGDIRKGCMTVADAKPAAEIKTAQAACETESMKCLNAAVFQEGAAASEQQKSTENAGRTDVEIIGDTSTKMLRTIAKD